LTKDTFKNIFVRAVRTEDYIKGKILIALYFFVEIPSLLEIKQKPKRYAYTSSQHRRLSKVQDRTETFGMKYSQFQKIRQDLNDEYEIILRNHQ